MANITPEQLQGIIQNAPPGANPSDIVTALQSQGHIIEGANGPTPQSGGFLGQAGHVVGDVVKGIVNPVIDNALIKPYQAVKSGIDFARDPLATPNEDVHLPGLGTFTGYNNKQLTPGNLEAPLGNAAQTVALGLSPVAGGALYGAGNAAVNDNGQYDLGNLIKGAVIGGVAGKAGELAFSAAGKALSAVGSKVLQPFSLGGISSDLTAAAERMGLDATAMPVGLVNPSVKGIEDLATSGFGGSKFKQAIVDTVNSMRQKLFNNASSLAEDLHLMKNDVTGGNFGALDSEAVGTSLQTKMKDMFAADSKTRDALFEKSIRNPELANTKMDYSNYKQALDEIITQRSLSNADPEAARAFEDLRANVSSAEKRTFANGFQTKKDIAAKAFPRPGSALYADPKTVEYQILYKALAKDLEQTASNASPELKDAFIHMNEQVKSMHAIYDDPIAKAIANSDNPGKIIDKIVKPGAIENIRFLKEAYDPELVNQVKAVTLDNIFEKATNIYGEVDGRALAKQLDKWDDASLKELFGTDGFQKLQEVKAQALLNDIVEHASQGGELNTKKLGTYLNKIEKDEPGMLESILPEGAYQKLQDIKTVGDKLHEYTPGQTEKPLTAANILGGLVLHSPLSPIKILADVIGGPAMRQFVESDVGKKVLTHGFGEMKSLVNAGQFLQDIPSKISDLQNTPIPGTPQLLMGR